MYLSYWSHVELNVSWFPARQLVASHLPVDVTRSSATSYIGAQHAAVVAVHTVEETQTFTCIARVDVATFQYQSANSIGQYCPHNWTTVSMKVRINTLKSGLKNHCVNKLPRTRCNNHVLAWVSHSAFYCMTDDFTNKNVNNLCTLSPKSGSPTDGENF